ncbi:MAG: NAD-dependent epimerase/dehydratase family protein [Proteobacteria bacterium]|nr:NAD-dependent epimerase/dehydratase family protein [Pseudomonadota bacterium]NBX85867.1 NAD-dependent epimerase/dehydratase family protein [Pseudomonadota bacterium]
MKILLTGAAGFIGFAKTQRLLAMGHQVVGIDNLSDYYSPQLKRARLRQLAKHPQAKNFTFHKLNLTNLKALQKLALATKPSHIIHLAAQASVRYGLTHQAPYLQSNLIGHFHILQVTKALADAGHPLHHLLYASSSSVYGNNEKVPFAETDDVSSPQSLYAATKRADELITHAWSHQFGLPATGLRFFTVYGPWGRPDMAPYQFIHATHTGAQIKLFNNGDLYRDFTYIDDIVEATVRLLNHLPNTPTKHQIYNLGNHQPVKLTDFITTLAKVTNTTPNTLNAPWPPTEVYQTYADTTKLRQAINWAPSTKLETGLKNLNDWYLRQGHKFMN